MSCFSISWIENVLIWLVVIGAIVAIVRLLLPHIVGPLGAIGSVVMQALYIIIWAIVIIAIIVIVFDLLACAIGMPRLRP